MTLYQDGDWNEFTEKLFSQPPQDPFSYTVSFLDQVDSKKVSELLGYMLIQGVRLRYSKEIAYLTPTEIEEVKNYYHSFGYDITYQVERKTQLETDVPLNIFHIDFRPYPIRYNRHNQPEKFR
jgi:HJR/Mrr/RecB family endonuclease